jgi:hypothetical protein
VTPDEQWKADVEHRLNHLERMSRLQDIAIDGMRAESEGKATGLSVRVDSLNIAVQKLAQTVELQSENTADLIRLSHVTLRQLGETNQRMDETNQRLGETNQRLDGLIAALLKERPNGGPQS